MDPETRYNAFRPNVSKPQRMSEDDAMPYVTNVVLTLRFFKLTAPAF
jgi:hypothetical protein